MKGKTDTQSVRLSKATVKAIKRYIIEEGGTIRSVLEEGAILKMAGNNVKKPKT